MVVLPKSRPGIVYRQVVRVHMGDGLCVRWKNSSVVFPHGVQAVCMMLLIAFFYHKPKCSKYRTTHVVKTP
jgi:hypothetical protein